MNVQAVTVSRRRRGVKILLGIMLWGLGVLTANGAPPPAAATAEPVAAAIQADAAKIADVGVALDEWDMTVVPERSGGWGTILARLDSQIYRANQTLERFMRSSRDEERNFLRFRQKIAHQTDELRFLLSVCDPEDVFGVTLRCEQIDEVRNSYQKSYDALSAIRNANAQLSRRVDGIRRELARLGAHPGYERYKSQIADCLEQYQLFARNARKIDVRLEQLLQDELAGELAALSATAEKVRSDTIDNIFFAPHSTFWQLLPTWRLIITYWYDTLSDARNLSRTRTNGRSAWPLAVLVGSFLAAAIGGGRRWLTPWLLRQTQGATPRQSGALCMAAEILLGIALALCAYEIFMPASYAAQLHQLSFSLLSYSLLFFALALRVGRGEFRRCVWLYTPFILQSILANTMYFLVIPYQALMLITVPVNLLVFVGALLILGLNRPLPRFDFFMGIIALLTVAAETVLAAYGFLYIGFTMMLTGMIVLGLFQAEVAVSKILLARIARNKNAIGNMVLYHLVLPLCWLGGVGVVIGNISSTYHLRGWVEKLCVAEVNVHQIFVLSIMNLLTIVIVLLALIFILALAKATIRDFYRNSADLGKVLSYLTLGTYIVWTVFVIFVLALCRLQYSSLLVILGGFSVGFGFALKEVLENFISGIILLLGQQVRPGDEIEFDGNAGIVKFVSFRATVIETFDGTIITLPNTNVLSKDFRNCTRKGHRMRHDLRVGVAYGSDLQLVRQTLLEAVNAVPEIYNVPAPEIHCAGFSDSAIDFIVRFWMHSGEQTQVFSALRERIVQCFRARGIEIPYNRLDVHLDGR